MLTTNDLPLHALFIPLVALLSRDSPLALRLFGDRLVYHLGLISYSVYLPHPLFERHFSASETAFTVSSLVAFAIIWALSYVSYLAVEMPGRTWIIRLLLPSRADEKPSAPAQNPAWAGKRPSGAGNLAGIRRDFGLIGGAAGRVALRQAGIPRPGTHLPRS